MAKNKIPHWIHMCFMMATCLLFVPPLLIARARYNKSDNPRVHPIPDMDNQKHYRKQAENPAFFDGRSMRLPVAGTVARGELNEDDHYYRGTVNGKFATSFPAQITLNRVFVDRGQERYEIYCGPCHGDAGYGDGMVHQRASVVSEATWTQPTNLHETGKDSPSDRSVGHLFNTISNGIRNMPPYRAQIPVEDRWAIVAYVRTLQRMKP